jgi:hypothetical protein
MPIGDPRMPRFAPEADIAPNLTYSPANDLQKARQGPMPNFGMQLRKCHEVRS